MKRIANSERELLTVLASDDRESTEPESTTCASRMLTGS